MVDYLPPDSFLLTLAIPAGLALLMFLVVGAETLWRMIRDEPASQRRVAGDEEGQGAADGRRVP